MQTTKNYQHVLPTKPTRINIDSVNNNLRVIQIPRDFIQMNSDMESSDIILPEE